LNIAGIDYGSKLAGTTVIAYLDNSMQVHFYQSEKKKDADQFVINCLKENKIDQVYIDAPLSLPGVYTAPKTFHNYFYREADTVLKAMSPMFLGGLTARAMQLRSKLPSVAFTEVYPSALVNELKIDRTIYKKEKEHITAVISFLLEKFSFIPSSLRLNNWHQVDALLALISGYRHQKNICIYYGNDYEGFIHI
jgi:predicted nuclease with RNAse H fold